MTVLALALAHRAGNAEGSAQAALALGADVLEADVHRYRGRFELRHSKAIRPLPLLYDAGRFTSSRHPRRRSTGCSTRSAPGPRSCST